MADAETDETFLLGIAAEGTRSKGDYWKSGFYRISQKTGLPVTLAFLDVPTRTVGWGPTFALSGDVGADMDRIRAFYADKRGFRPGDFTEPRLREEDRGRDPGRVGVSHNPLTCTFAEADDGPGTRNDPSFVRNPDGTPVGAARTRPREPVHPLRATRSATRAHRAGWWACSAGVQHR